MEIKPDESGQPQPRLPPDVVLDLIDPITLSPYTAPPMLFMVGFFF